MLSDVGGPCQKVCDVGWVPLLCVWKIEQTNFESGKKSVGALFWDLRDFETGGDPKKKCSPHYPLQIGANITQA